MKKILLLITYLTISIAALSQNDYSRGFNNGYKKGYCYKEFACIEPIPPIAPVPRYDESWDSYIDGYNRGFKMGLEDKSAKKSSGGTYQGGENVQQNQSFNHDLLLKAMEMKQAQIAREEKIENDKAVAKMQQTKSFYNSLTSYPSRISDGWHNIVAMDNYEFCDERKVYVSDNKITKYVIDNYDDRTVTLAGYISNGKTLIKIVGTDDTPVLLDIYFIDDMVSSNSYVPPPTQAGTVSFWTSWRNSASLRLFFDGEYVGPFNVYFKEGGPSCGQEGTITIKYKPGTYNYRATATGSFRNLVWEGSVTISSGGCVLQEIRK